MKQFSKQFHKSASAVKLQAAEKRELRERLVSYMEYHPLPTELQGVKASKSSKQLSKAAPLFTDTFSNVSIPFATIFKYSSAVAVVALMVVPFMAEQTVPGDTLYAVKVQFNEELKSTLTFDGYQKVEWETTRLNRRIAEARLLASEGRLTEEIEVEVAEAVKVHTDNAKKEIEALRINDADGAEIASIELDTTLEVQSASLKSDNAEDSDSASDSTNLIASAIDKSLEQTEVQLATPALPAYDKMMARIEQNTTRVHELLSTLNSLSPENDFVEVTRRLDDIERSIESAVSLSETDDMASRLGLIDVLQRTQKLIVYMAELEVIEAVDIETLVPVVLTDVEEGDEAARLTAELDLKIAEIEELSLEIIDEDILAKVSFAQALLATTSIEMASSSENFEVFEKLAVEALEIADDILTVLKNSLEPVVVVEPVLEEEVATSTEDAVEDVAATEEVSSTAESLES